MRSVGVPIAPMMEMMPITTSNSVRVNPAGIAAGKLAPVSELAIVLFGCGQWCLSIVVSALLIVSSPHGLPAQGVPKR